MPTETSKCENVGVSLVENNGSKKSENDILETSILKSHDSPSVEININNRHLFTIECEQKNSSQILMDCMPDEKYVTCRLTEKKYCPGQCIWKGPQHEFQQHCQDTHPNGALSLCDSETHTWASARFLNSISVKIIDDDIFWSFVRVTFKENKRRILNWAVLAEGPVDSYYIETEFFAKGNILKKIIFTERCLNGDIDVETAFQSENCITIPLEILQSYFGMSEKYMDLIYNTASIIKKKL